MADLLVTLGSVCAGASAFQLSRTMAALLTADPQKEIEAHDQRQMRYRLLRESSLAFQCFERAAVPLSHVIQRFLKQDEKIRTTAGSLRHLVQTICLGNSREIEKATEIRALEHPWKPAEFVATGLIVASASAIASTIIMLRSVTGVWLVIFTFAVFFATYRIWLRRFVQQAKAKQQRVLQLLPHAVDTITMVMQSGGTFLAGIESVIRDFPTHPLSLELQRMRNRLNRGQTMREAIELTARSIRLPEFDDVARILSRIHQHGASSTDSFARLSKQMRLAHLRRMEEQVGQAESKMSLPTMLILFSCMLVCLGPFLLAVSEIKFFD